MEQEKVYVLAGNANDPFQHSRFIGDETTALNAGYTIITKAEYKKILKHELKWDNNGHLIENNEL